MIKIPEKIQYAIEKIQNAGFEAYIVGGCVRDSLLKVPPHDFDITTSAKPEEIQEIFPKTVPTGIKHGTITVIIGKEPIEVTTFRTEGNYSDGRHPDSTEFVTDLKFDLSRRDFTVNAMAYNENCGTVDLFGGMNDLENRILRAVGDPYRRFSEDALRILRLFRFACQLDFDIEETTLKASIDLKDKLKNLSRERVFAELFKMPCGISPERFAPIIESGGLEFLNIKNLPDFNIIKKCQPNQNLAFYSFLMMSCSDINKTLNKLKVSNTLKAYCQSLSVLKDIELPKTKPSIKEVLNLTSPPIFEDYILLKTAMGINTQDLEKLYKEIIENNEPYRIRDLKIDGSSLKKIGFKGTEIGEKLEFLRKHIIYNPQDNTKKKLYNLLLQ